MDGLHKGKSIKLYLIDGTPNGLLTAEVMNWTGHIISGSRSKLAELIKRPEVARTGIYFLTGSDPDISGKSIVYIGETDNVGKRLIQHNKDVNKDFWEKACVITSKDQNLTKAHVRYLESRLIAITQKSGRADIHNNTAPDYGYLPEADIADMEYFISQIRLILPVLGLDFLREKTKIKTPINQNEEQGSLNSPLFIIQSKKHNITAEAQEVDGDFIVMSGSEANAKWSGTAKHSYHQLYKNLFDDKKLLISEGKAIFQEDVSFKSPSAASAIIFGRASNGRTAWKVKDTRKTYADWQDEIIGQAA